MNRFSDRGKSVSKAFVELFYKHFPKDEYNDFDYDDDRYWYPRIRFKKSISDEEMDRMTKIQMDHDEAQLRREQGF